MPTLYTALLLLGLASACAPETVHTENGTGKPDSALNLQSQAIKIAESNHLTISDISYAGVGCPAGSVPMPNIAADGQAFTVLFSEFLVSYAVPSHQRRQSKSCRLSLSLTTEGANQLAILALDQRGFANIGAGDRLSLQTAASFNRPNFASRQRLRGPFLDDFQWLQELPLRRVSWSRCASVATLTIDLSLTLNASGRQDAFATLDSSDGVLQQQYRIAARPCRNSELTE